MHLSSGEYKFNLKEAALFFNRNGHLDEDEALLIKGSLFAIYSYST